MTDADRKRRLKARQAVLKAAANRDEARRKLLAQRRELAERRRRNRERSTANREAESTGGTNRNPSTHSTMPDSDTNAEASARSPHSTVPGRPMYSSVTPRERLYGLRLRRAARDEDGGDAE